MISVYLCSYLPAYPLSEITRHKWVSEALRSQSTQKAALSNFSSHYLTLNQVNFSIQQASLGGLVRREIGLGREWLLSLDALEFLPSFLLFWFSGKKEMKAWRWEQSKFRRGWVSTDQDGGRSHPITGKWVWNSRDASSVGTTFMDATLWEGRRQPQDGELVQVPDTMWSVFSDLVEKRFLQNTVCLG